MTTIATFRDRISRRLLGQETPLIDRLTAAISSTSAETCTVEWGNAGLAEGSIIEIDSEQMYVVSLSTLTVTMLRGWNGTTAATHADNSLVYINPRFTIATLLELIEEELHSWPVQLGKVATEEVSITKGEVQAELTVATGLEVVRILNAQIFHDSRSTIDRRDSVDVKLIRDTDEDEFTSGWAIQVGSTYANSRTVQVDYLTRFDTSALTTTSTDLQTGVGLTDSQLDILLHGVMWRALVTREAGRTAESAVQRGDTERVPPTHLLQTAEAFKKVRDERLSDEIFRMYDRYPVLMTMGA